MLRNQTQYSIECQSSIIEAQKLFSGICTSETLTSNNRYDIMSDQCDTSDSDSDTEENSNNNEQNNICATCELRVREKQEAINCNQCNIWYHIICQDINSDEYEMIKVLIDKIKWFCFKCQDKTAEVNNENKILKEELKKLKNDNNALQNRNDEDKTIEVNNKNKILKEEIKKL